MAMAETEKSTESTVKEETFKPKKWRQFLAALIASNGTLGLGTILGWSGVADFENDFGQLIPSQKSWIASLPLLGAFTSAMLGACAMKKMGSRKLMMVLCLPYLLGWLQIIFANSVRMLYFGRFILGFAAGPMILTVPVFIFEISSAKFRSHLTGLTIVQLVHGMLFAYIKGALANWLWLSVAMAPIPLFMFIGLYFFPETPAFLLKKGKETAAVESLKWYRGASDIKQIDPEFQLIKSMVGGSQSDSESQPKMKILDWFKTPARTPLMLCCMAMVIQQWSGIGILVMYTLKIFHIAGLTITGQVGSLPLSPNLSAIIMGFGLVWGVTASGLLIKKMGTKIPLVGSCVGMALSWVLLGVYFYVKFQNFGKEATPPGLGVVPVVSMVAIAFLYGVGLCTVPWMLPSQIMSPNLAGTATGIAASFNWLAAFVLVKTFDDVIGSIGIFTLFWIIAFFCLIAALYFYFVLPGSKVKNSLDITPAKI